jgi:hypothetical protein
MTNHKPTIARKSGPENVGGAISRDSFLVSRREMTKGQFSTHGNRLLHSAEKAQAHTATYLGQDEIVPHPLPKHGASYQNKVVAISHGQLLTRSEGQLEVESHRS